MKIPDASRPLGVILETLSVHTPKPAYEWWMEPDVGPDVELDYRSATWYRAAQAKENDEGRHEFDGDPRSGIRPAHYMSAGILSLDAELIDETMHDGELEHGVAYAMGSTAMFAKVPDGYGEEFVRGHRRYVVAQRIGKGMLVASAMPVHVEEKRLITVPDALVNYRAVDIDKVPPHVPIV